MTTMDPRSRHLAIYITQIKNINFCDVPFEKQKGITYDELSWFMKPFPQKGESNLARIERRSANFLDRAEQNMDFTMLTFAPYVL